MSRFGTLWECFSIAMAMLDVRRILDPGVPSLPIVFSGLEAGCDTLVRWPPGIETPDARTNPKSMKPNTIASLLTGALIHTAQAAPGDLLWSDNFNLGSDTTNFDGSSLAGRLGGPLGAVPDCVARASGIQQWITADQLDLRGGRIRFQRSAAGARFDWAGTAAGSSAANIAAGASILDSGGLKISFDYVPTNNTSTNWVNVSVGFPGAFDGQAINYFETDYGVLLRNNGGTERWDNGANKGPGGSFPATTTSRHADYLYAFTSFANGTEVRSRVIVDGVQVAADTFLFENNGGEFYFVVEVGEVATLVDNLTVTTIPTIYEMALTGDEFISGIDPGDPVATLSSSTFAKGPEASTYAFVAGTGDDDNGKFVIDGSTIKAGAYDFTLDPEGTEYFIRVQGTGSVTGGTKEFEHIFTLIKDDDADGLQDDWELDFAGNLTSLNGLAAGPGPGAGTGDFDNDGLTDLQEFNLSLGAFPTISPVLADTDGDTLNDNEEQNPVAPRPVTNPLLADTDKDGLNDGVESNSGTFVGPTDTGSSAIDPDSDDDGVRDGFEVANASNPVDFVSRPALSPAFAIVPVTDEASTGISASTTYTHKISGGGPATINGVSLDELNPISFPANFNWSVSSGALAEVNPINNATWVPATGGMTGAGLLDLFGGFTYNTNGNPEGFQTYTLSGLEIGKAYKLKIFVRPWDNVSASFRPIDFRFTNGATVDEPFGALPTDRPGIVLNNANNNSAYYVSYDYVAEATDLVIRARVHESALPASGSFHLYGLTNEIVPGVGLVVTAVSRDGSGNFIIDFTGEPDTTYNVTKSPDLTTPFGPLTIPLTATTDGAGVGQATVPSAEASETREFYRIESQ
jgi:hypothetical protein